ncbi:MAG: GIY-YIG nuclease family protein [Candidatus Onthomonas sp.]
MPNSVQKKGKTGTYYVYILQCGDGTYYTGSTTDLERRLAAHTEGRGAKYTRGRGPLRLVYREELESWSAALRREAAIKKLSRAEKTALIAQSAEREKRSETC